MAAIEVRNLENVQRKISRVAEIARRQGVAWVTRAERLAYDKAKELTALTDHSLAVLRRLGHPYALRYGPNTFVHPDYMVHMQSGTLQAGLEHGHVEQDTAAVAWLTNRTWYDRYIQLGSVRMRARPYMAHTREEITPVLMAEAAHLLRQIRVEVTGP